MRFAFIVLLATVAVCNGSPFFKDMFEKMTGGQGGGIFESFKSMSEQMMTKMMEVGPEQFKAMCTEAAAQGEEWAQKALQAPAQMQEAMKAFAENCKSMPQEWTKKFQTAGPEQFQELCAEAVGQGHKWAEEMQKAPAAMQEVMAAMMNKMSGTFQG